MNILDTNSQRLSNLELLRLVCMLMVVCLHLNTYTIGDITQEEVLLTPITGFVRTFAKQICIIAVNVFVFISGWFGIRASVKGFLNILTQVYFWGLILLIPTLIAGNFEVKILVKVLLGGLFWWFIPSYIILYLFSPLLNTFVAQSNKKQLGVFLLLYFVMEFIFGWLGCVPEYEDGYSALSFIGLYLLARWLHLYYQPILTKYKAIHYFLSYLLVTIVAASISFFGMRIVGFNMKTWTYSCPFVVLATVLFFLVFYRIPLKHNSFINWCSKSALSIYLFHMHLAIIPYWRPWFHDQYFILGGGKYLLLCLLAGLVFGFICICIDKIRISLVVSALSYCCLGKRRIGGLVGANEEVEKWLTDRNNR